MGFVADPQGRYTNGDLQPGPRWFLRHDRDCEQGPLQRCGPLLVPHVKRDASLRLSPFIASDRSITGDKKVFDLLSLDSCSSTSWFWIEPLFLFLQFLVGIPAKSSRLELFRVSPVTKHLFIVESEVWAADRTVMDGFKLDAPRQYFATSSLVVGYALCSSLLSVINKFAITMFDYPGLLTALQYLTSAVGVWVLGKLGFLYHDPFIFETAKKFLPAATVFYLAIFTNTNLLRHANVDTFIMFRSLTPLLVAIADTIFRKQPCPSKLTFLSLVVVLGGAVGYVLTDSAFNLIAYSWAIAYLVTITTEMVYIKHMVTNLGLNTWGFVFYNNLLSLMMAPVFWIATGEYADVFTAYGSSSGIWFNIMAFVAVALSCVFGFLISFFGFAARKAISATAFTVTGVANKFLTVAINVLIWDKHASKIGLLCLLLTLVGGVLYQQSVTGNGNFAQLHGSTISKKANGVVGNVDSEDKRHDKRLSRRDSSV
ncbi:hypothetical protein GW17_00057028 [Ensete ventricosum]|nr:hypothetical protein GW17_00057028 [Ensete ventricosum]